MRKHRFVEWMFSVGMMILGAGVVSGQNYPNKPIRIVTSDPGGGTDSSARVVAQGLAGLLGQPAIVDNRRGIVPGQIVANARPDGYTLLVIGFSFWAEPLFQKVSYDPIKDFSPITFLSTSPNTLVVHPSLSVKTVKELIALATARPGELNYASPGIGSSTFLTVELFKAMANVNILHIPYRGGAGSMTALISGQVQMSFGSGVSVAPHIKSGKLMGLAVTSAQPSALFPELPTVAATLPGYEMSAATAMFAPARTPKAIIDRLHQETVRILNQQDVKDQYLKSGAEVVGSSPEQLDAKMKSEVAKFGKLIKDAGIRTE